MRLRYADMIVQRLLCGAAALAIALPAPARADDATANAAACIRITDRVARLECFDRAFATPLPQPPTAPATAAADAKPQPGPLQSLAQEQERTRPDGKTGWITRIRPWGSNSFLPADAVPDSHAPVLPGQPASAEQIDLFLTTPESDPEDADHKAILMITCENNITSLLAVLPKPIAGARAKMSLSSGGTMLPLNWRDVEQGKVIIAGRGLESIDTLQSLMAFKQVQLQVELATGPTTYSFELADLTERLKPLRLACHW